MNACVCAEREIFMSPTLPLSLSLIPNSDDDDDRKKRRASAETASRKKQEDTLENEGKRIS